MKRIICILLAGFGLTAGLTPSLINDPAFAANKNEISVNLAGVYFGYYALRMEYGLGYFTVGPRVLYFNTFDDKKAVKGVLDCRGYLFSQQMIGLYLGMSFGYTGYMNEKFSALDVGGAIGYKFMINNSVIDLCIGAGKRIGVYKEGVNVDTIYYQYYVDPSAYVGFRF